MNTLLNDHPWIGVDLDATLAHYDEWHGIDHIGEPIPAMRQRVLQWLSEGKHVRILTARVGPQRHDVPHTIEEITHHIEQWCLKHLGQVLPVTCAKDYNMVAFYDDRCMQVIPNKGTCVVDDFNQRLIDRTTGFRQTLGQQSLEIAHLRSALQQAYVHNQNMHCFVTKGRLNDQLNEQTHVLRKALGIPGAQPPEAATVPYAAEKAASEAGRKIEYTRLCVDNGCESWASWWAEVTDTMPDWNNERLRFRIADEATADPA